MLPHPPHLFAALLLKRSHVFVTSLSFLRCQSTAKKTQGMFTHTYSLTSFKLYFSIKYTLFFSCFSSLPVALYPIAYLYHHLTDPYLMDI